MDEWLGRFAAALVAGLGDEVPAVDVGPGGDARVRELGQIVAGAAGPDAVPLASFLVGAYVALRVGEGAAGEQAMAEALRVARRVLARETATGD